MDFLKVDTNRRHEIYKSYNTNEDEIQKNVEILKEWLKKQAHLPQKLPYDGFLEQMLKNNKYRIEKTKERIDNYFTLKTVNLEIFKALANENVTFSKQTSIKFTESPFYLENNIRLLFAYLKSPDLELFDFEEYLRIVFANLEIYLRYNNSLGVRIIIDVKNCLLGHLKKLDFAKIPKAMKLILDGYGFKVTGIDILNLPNYCNPIFALFKSISSPKILDRMKVHDSLESLYKEIPRDLLPEELGGTASYSLDESAEISETIYKNQRNFLMDSINYVSNEDLRIGKSKYSDDMFGVDGTFKQLTID